MRKPFFPFARLQKIVLILTITFLFIQMVLLVWYVKIQYVSQNQEILNYKLIREEYVLEKNYQDHKMITEMFSQDIYIDISDTGDYVSFDPSNKEWKENLSKSFDHLTTKIVPLSNLKEEEEFEFTTQKIVLLDNLKQKLPENVFKTITEYITSLNKLHQEDKVTQVQVPEKQHTPFTNRPTTIFDKLKKLEDIEPSSDNIFFIESKCGTLKLSEAEMKKRQQKEFVINVRQSCSVESAATLNPSRNVYVLHTCPLNKKTPEYAKQLLSLENVWLVHLNVTEFFQGTPVEELFRSGLLEKSSFPVEHSSDIMRLTVLWRYGGTYLDLDVITLRLLDDLKTNFCGLESKKLMGNAILNFEPQGYGHDLLTKILKYLNNNFDGRYWAVNGPALITKIILEECNSTIETVKNCTVFNVYDRTVLYPIPWIYYLDIFSTSPGVGTNLTEIVKKTGYLAHMWNKYTHVYNVSVESSQAYALLAEQFCPRMCQIVKVFK